MVRLDLCGALVLVGLLACGGRAVETGETGEGTASTAASGAEEAEAGEEAEADADAEAEAEVDSGADADAGEEDTGVEDGCTLGIRLDWCCNQPEPVTFEFIESEPCYVAWPVDWESIPAELLEECVAKQPESCELVDCDYAAPASEIVEFNQAGACAYVCPKGEGIGYAGPGCGDPPPIAACYPPPPPCAMDYCSCKGETIIGCGITGEPFAYEGICE